MKKIPVILLSLLLVSLLILGGLFFFTYSRKESDAKAENKTLQSNIASLQEQLQQKEDFISGQEEYINELTTQLADCQTTTDSEEEEDEDDEDNTSSGYEKKYPDLYAGATYSEDGDSSDLKVYLTFDDGPSDLTPEVLDLLDKYDAKATFFVVYTDNEEYTSYLKEIVERGHTLALHSYSHDYDKIYKSVDAFLSDFETVYNWVYEETGVRPTLFRFPGGSTNGKKSVVNDIIAEMERRGFIYYDWNVSSGDGSNLTTTENILENVCTNVGSFDQPVVLMHDGVGKNATLKALPTLLETLAEEGYEFCSLDENLTPIQYKRK
ncbi:polysaccharide deacetylase family protein [Roseburia sp. 499]|uniref:polysaccharide deacetylase family protein n=1 Tax=Roseburia sp. 499 TaxID=1261634 RepID=UPI000950CB5F|nr:polysaccharide deacetylase family protein [Roseburia sp. 499]WVK70194.1 polysaccharide deacetylase family protein [Roseburia sp. 499]